MIPVHFTTIQQALDHCISKGLSCSIYGRHGGCMNRCKVEFDGSDYYMNGIKIDLKDVVRISRIVTGDFASS